MHQQGSDTHLQSLQQEKRSGFVGRLEVWHAAYTRINPWAHGGFFERIIHKLNADGIVAREGKQAAIAEKQSAARRSMLANENNGTPLSADAY